MDRGIAWDGKGKEGKGKRGIIVWFNRVGIGSVGGLWCVGRGKGEVKGVYMAWQGKGKGRLERDYYKKFLTTFCVSVSWVRVLC
jgi:hypothetical protein